MPTGNYCCLVNLHNFHSDILAVFIMLRFFSSIVVIVVAIDDDVAVVVMAGCAVVFLLSLLLLTFHLDILQFEVLFLSCSIS